MTTSFRSKSINLGDEVTFWLFLPPEGDVLPGTPVSRTGRVVKKCSSMDGLCVEDQNERVWVHLSHVVEVRSERGPGAA